MLRFLAKRGASVLGHARSFSTPSQVVKPTPLKVLFMGSGQFAMPSLQLLKHRTDFVSELELVCPPDRPKGRGQQVVPVDAKVWAEKYNVPVHQPSPDTDFKLTGWEMPPGDFDLGVVVSFGYFIPKRVIESFKHGMLNVHPSLLPKYRGAAPIQHALINGDDKIGMSIIDIHPDRLDAGKIRRQAVFPLNGVENYSMLVEPLGMMGAQLLVDVINDIARGVVNPGMDQPITTDPNIPRAPKIPKSRGHIHWETDHAVQLSNLWRGLNGFLPVFTFFNGKRIQLRSLWEYKGSLLNDPEWLASSPRPGRIGYDAEYDVLAIECADKTVLSCKLVKLEAGKDRLAKDFANGHLHSSKIGWTDAHFSTEQPIDAQ